MIDFTDYENPKNSICFPNKSFPVIDEIGIYYDKGRLDVVINNVSVFDTKSAGDDFNIEIR